MLVSSVLSFCDGESTFDCRRQSLSISRNFRTAKVGCGEVQWGAADGARPTARSATRIAASFGGK